MVRGGYGIYYGAFENRGGYPSLGYNYPFQYTFNFPSANAVSPTVFPNGTIATLENGLSSVPLESGRRQRFRPGSCAASSFITRHPTSRATTSPCEYQLAHSDVLSAGYVASLSRHLETFVGTNLQSVLLPPGSNPQDYVPVPGFRARFLLCRHYRHRQLSLLASQI